MNRTKSKYTRIALLVIGSVLVAQPVVTLAQNTAVLSLEEREQRQLNALNENLSLSLSSHQLKQIKQVLADRDASLAVLRNDSSLAPEDRHAKMADIWQSSSVKIRTLLTADQQPLYDDLLASQQQDREQARVTSTVASQSVPPSTEAAVAPAF
jgi:hypothetical protein